MVKVEKNDHDVVVIGGGPGGLTAAMWCAELGLRAVLIDAGTEIGGQMLKIYGAVRNYPGIIAANGRELAKRFAGSADRFDFERRLGQRVTAIEPGSINTISLESGEKFFTRNVILATGTRRRQLGVPGEAEFAGRGILISGVGEREKAAGGRVVIVGGGDAALENAVLLSKTARSVTIVHRREHFTARAEFQAAADEQDNVICETEAVVTEIIGEERVTGIVVRNLSTGQIKKLEADHILIRIGQQPNSELLAGMAELDAAGYVKVGPDCQTSVPGIFAVGDVANPVSPTIATAAGTGTTAAKMIYHKSGY